ncbi:MAG: hypothetical protein RL149_776 [Actinomycetota bacterium]
MQQATLAASVLRASDWDFIASSPLTRAKQTAEAVAKQLQISEVAIEELLLERSFGDAEGMTHEEWKRDFPDGLPPGGESLDELRQRANLLLAKLLETYRGTRVLTVSHGALIRKLVRVVSQGELPLAGQRFGNTSLTTIVHENGLWRIENFDPEPIFGSRPA